MEILNVVYSAKKGMRDQFYQAVCDAGIPEASRGERGLVAYEFYKSLENSSDILLVEIWEDKESRAKHKTTAHFGQLRLLYDEYLDHYVVHDYSNSDPR